MFELPLAKTFLHTSFIDGSSIFIKLSQRLTTDASIRVDLSSQSIPINNLTYIVVFCANNIAQFNLHLHTPTRRVFMFEFIFNIIFFLQNKHTMLSTCSSTRAISVLELVYVGSCTVMYFSFISSYVNDTK